MVENSVNIQKIISHIGGFDALGDHPLEIDTQKEYNLLGQYLNGSYQIENLELKNLKRNEKKSLKNLLNELKEKWGNLSNDKVEPNIITRENVEEYLKKYQDLYYHSSQNLTEDELKLALNKIEQAFKGYMKEIGLPEPYEGDYVFKIRNRLKVLDFIQAAENMSKSTLEYIKEPSKKEILKSKVEEFLANNKLNSSDTTEKVDIGDGDFNDIVVQKSDVCWGLGGINSLAQSDTGLSLLENNRFRDEETGVYAIHLKEAENYDLPSGGIYIITPQEIIEASQTVAEGEGDSVAYLLAIDKYFQELKNHKPEISETKNFNDITDGNSSSRFYEILTGGTATSISESSRVNEELPKGINFGNGISYQQIGEIVQSGRGAAVLSIALEYGGKGHALSVVGVENGKLVIQESNNNQELFLSSYKDFDNKDIFKATTPINGAPAYTISELNFKMFTSSRTVLRWE